MEHGIGFDGIEEVTSGQFPQIGGMRFSLDPTAPSGGRVRSLAIVDGTGAVTDRVVRETHWLAARCSISKVVTLNFLANGGDSYPFPVPSTGRIDLVGEAGQTNAPAPDFPDTNGNRVLDGPALVDIGLASFTGPGTEQDALSEYLARFFAEALFGQAERPPLEDRRIQDLGITGKQDTMFE